MGHYEDQREKAAAINAGVNQVAEVNRVGLNLMQLVSEMGRKKSEAEHHLNRVKDSKKIVEFAEKFKQAGAFGMAGMIHKIPELIPEVAPAFPAIMALNEVANIQMELIAELSKRVEELEGVNRGG